MPSRGSGNHSFRRDGYDSRWNQTWEEFKVAAKEEKTTPSAIIRAYIRYHLHLGAAPKRPDRKK